MTTITVIPTTYRDKYVVFNNRDEEIGTILKARKFIKVKWFFSAEKGFLLSSNQLIEIAEKVKRLNDAL